jgi:hypothetical protein
MRELHAMRHAVQAICATVMTIAWTLDASAADIRLLEFNPLSGPEYTLLDVTSRR